MLLLGKMGSLGVARSQAIRTEGGWERTDTALWTDGEPGWMDLEYDDGGV